MTAPPAGALEACPFCGREAHLTFDKSFGGFVSCSTEGCAGNAHAAQHDRSQIIAAWNRRTHGPALLAALRLREWQRIESAPERGELLTWHDFGVRVANPAHPDYGMWGRPIVQQRLTGRAFFPSDITDAGRVTHWMPLPAPPTADDLARVLEEGE